MSRLLARAIMASPAGRLVRFLAGSPPPRAPRLLKERIADGYEELLRQGYTPMAALAAAEAVETGKEHGLYFHGVRFDDVELRWYGVYSGDAADSPLIHVPLPHASEAHQRGYAVLN